MPLDTHLDHADRMGNQHNRTWRKPGRRAAGRTTAKHRRLAHNLGNWIKMALPLCPSPGLLLVGRAETVLFSQLG
jgi:hypothetical protein